MKVFTLQKEIYRNTRIDTRPVSDVAGCRREVLERWRWLRLRKGLSASDAARAVGVSRASLFRWERRLQGSGPAGLEPRSRRPHRVRRRQWSSRHVSLVRRLRKQFPVWGKEKLTVLAAQAGWETSESTVGRVLSMLITKGEVLPASAFVHRMPRRKRRRHKRPHAQRFPRGYKPQRPGDLLQVDTMFVSLLPGKMVAHFNASDYVSNWAVGRSYRSASAGYATRFLKQLVEAVPFSVRAIQVDGGSEFMAEFETTCAELGIRLFVLPPRSPNLNGKVERLNFSWRYEFFATTRLPTDPQHLHGPCQRFERLFNTFRPHKALGNLTPARYIATHFPDLRPNLSHIY